MCILQEAFTNVRKHAEASCVAVEITEENQDNAKQVLLHIADNGVGFKLAASKRSFGLQTMRERAESVGGKLFIAASGERQRYTGEMPAALFAAGENSKAECGDR